MIPKIPLLSLLVVGTTSLMTWGGFVFHDNYQYNSKMKKYAEWRSQFFTKPLNKQFMDENKDKCKKENKSYLPFPYEEWFWEKAFKNLENKRTQDGNENVLLSVNNSEDLKDYCYEEIKKDNDGIKMSKNNEDAYFNPNENSPKSTKHHDKCVLNGNELD